MATDLHAAQKKRSWLRQGTATRFGSIVETRECHAGEGRNTQAPPQI